MEKKVIIIIINNTTTNNKKNNLKVIDVKICVKKDLEICTVGVKKQW